MSPAAELPCIPALHPQGFSEKRGRKAGARSHALSTARMRDAECWQSETAWVASQTGARAGRERLMGSLAESTRWGKRRQRQAKRRER